MTDQLKQAQQTVGSQGEEKWNQMSEEQKKATFVHSLFNLIEYA